MTTTIDLDAADIADVDEAQEPRAGTRWRRYTLIVFAGATAALVYLLLIAQTGVAHADGLNPFTDVKPDPGLLGTALNTAWKRLLGAIWALALIILGGQMVMALMKRSQASRQGHSADLAESTDAFRDAGIRFAMASGISIIVGAILFAVNA